MSYTAAIGAFPKYGVPMYAYPTYGFPSGGYVWMMQVLAQLEKTSAGGYTLIDYRYIEPGLADHTFMDEILERLGT